MLCAELMLQQSSVAPVCAVSQVCGRQRLNLLLVSSVILLQFAPRSLMEASVSSATDLATAIEWQVSPAWVVYVLPDRQVLFVPSAVLGNVSSGGGLGVVLALTWHPRPHLI